MHNVSDACISITRASGRGLGPGIREIFGPCEMASSRKASAIWGPKNSREGGFRGYAEGGEGAGA